MGPHLQKIEDVLNEGVTLLTWSSLNITSFVESAEREIEKVRLLLQRTTDILDHRIQQLLKQMSEVTLCELPEVEPWTVGKLMSRTEVCVCVCVCTLM